MSINFRQCILCNVVITFTPQMNSDRLTEMRLFGMPLPLAAILEQNVKSQNKTILKRTC